MGMVASPAVLAPKEANKAATSPGSRSSLLAEASVSFVLFLLVIERGGRRKRGMFWFSTEHIRETAVQTKGKSVKSVLIG